MKKIYGYLLAGSLALSFVAASIVLSTPKDAKAVKANDEGFFIGDHNFLTDNVYDRTEEGLGKAEYNPSTKTLTFTDFTYSGTGYEYDTEWHYFSAFYYCYNSDLTIKFYGTNNIEISNPSAYFVYGMWFESYDQYEVKVNIQGADDAFLNVTSPSNHKNSTAFVAIQPQIIMQSGNVNATAGISNDYDSAGADIANFEMRGGTFTARSLGSKKNSYGLMHSCSNMSRDKVVISGGTLTAIAGDTTGSDTKSIGCDFYYYKRTGSTGPEVSITGGSFHAEAGKGNKSSIGIRVQNCTNFDIKGGEVVATGINDNNKDGNGILYYTYNTNFLKSLNVSQNANATFVGNTYAVSHTNNTSEIGTEGYIKNSIPGLGWSDTAGQEDKTFIQVNEEDTSVSFKKVHFEPSIGPAVFSKEPTVKSDLTYTGEAQELINAGESEQGTVLYRLGDSGEFSEIIPTATEVGTYSVSYKIQADNNHVDSDVKTLSVSIAEAVSPDDPSNPDNPSKPSRKGIGAGGVVGITLGSILLLIVGAWLLLMFVFNKWIKVEDKAVRAFKLFGIKKNGKYVVWGFPFRFTTRDELEIFSSKEDALK